GYAEARELVVVLGDAVVHEHEWGSDVAVLGVGVVGGQLLTLLAGGGIVGDGGLLELGDILRAAVYQLNDALLRCGIQNVKRLDLGIEAELLELGGDPLGVVLIVGGADVVGARGEALHVGAEILGLGDGLELLLPLTFGAGRLGGETEEGFVVGGGECAV